MTFTFTLSKLAHWQGLRAIVARTFGYKVTAVFFWGLPVVLLLATVSNGHDPLDAILHDPVLVLGGPFFMLVGFPVIHFLIVLSTHKRNALLQNPQTFEFTPTHLRMRGPLHTAELDWRAVDRVIETRSSFLFYTGRSTAQFLPKTAIGARELGVLRQRLIEWLPGRVKLRGQKATVLAAA